MLYRADSPRSVRQTLAGWGALAALVAVGVALPSPTTAQAVTPATQSPATQTLAAQARAAQARTWYRGRCRTSAGVTVVVDFQRLGAYRGHSGRTVVRCAKGPTRGRSGLWALKRARLAPQGTAQFGNAFICRIQGRPAANEGLRLGGNRYEERCIQTPPRNAFWGYWRAQRGGPWRYSSSGAATTTVIPGGFEGWSFSLRARRGNHPKPDVAPRRPAGRTHASGGLVQTSGMLAGAEDVPAEWAASQGADWLIAELDEGALPGPVGGADWGLTLDALFALEATGASESASTAIMAAVEADADTFIGPALYDDPDARIAGSVAKLLAAAAVTGEDASAFAGYDLRAETLALIQPGAGEEPGRLSDQDTGFDNSNIFGQAWAVVGLARTGGVPARAVDFLLDQQCRPGWFRVVGDSAAACDPASSRADTDATAMATQALMAARESGVQGLDRPIEDALDWLEDAQRPDGAFAGGASTPGANTNTTGLAGQTLLAGGRTRAAVQAQAWIGSMQLTDAQDESGAIAYDASGRTQAVRQGIRGPARDQWRRATSQALLGLGAASFGKVGEHATDPGTADSDASDPAPAASSVPVDDGSGVPLWAPGLGALVLLAGLAALRARRSSGAHP